MINSITNANAYIAGNKLAGKLTELALPDVKLKMVEDSPLGLRSPINIPSGVEGMEAKFKFNAIYPEVWKSQTPGKTCNVIAKSSMQQLDASGVKGNVAVTATIAGLFTEMPTGTIKQGEKLEAEHLMKVTYYKLEVGGEVVWEIDVYNDIYKHFGNDMFASNDAQ